MPAESVDYIAIGAALRAGREAKGWTQKELARKLQITPQGVSERELGKAKPSPHVLAEHAALVGVNFALYIGPPEDEAAAILAELARLLPVLNSDRKGTLAALVRHWKTEHDASGVRSSGLS